MWGVAVCGGCGAIFNAAPIPPEDIVNSISLRKPNSDIGAADLPEAA